MASRRIPLILAAAWFVLAIWSWRAVVPLSPDGSFLLMPYQAFRGFTSDGLVMIVGKSEDMQTGQVSHDGPIELFQLPGMTKVREVFTDGERLLTFRPDPLGRIVVLRYGEIWLASFKTGELLEKLPDVEMFPEVMWLDGDRLLWCDRFMVGVYDVPARRRLAQHFWFVSAYELGHSLTWLVPRDDNAGGILLNNVTGELDHRFDHLKPIKWADLSPDGTYALLGTGATASLCELASGKLLWSMPNQKPGGLAFDAGSRMLVMHYLDANAVIRTARWRVADGSVVDPLRTGADEHSHPTFEPNFRYAFYHKNIERRGMRYAFDRAKYEVLRITGGKPDGISVDRSLGRLCDVETGETFVLTDENFGGGVFSPDGSWLVTGSRIVESAPRYAFYRVPPRRDFSWLIRWGLLPPAIVLVLNGLIARRRLRRA